MSYIMSLEQNQKQGFIAATYNALLKLKPIIASLC